MSNKLQKLAQDYDFALSILGISNYRRADHPKRFLIQHIINNVESLEGDIYEFGVYKGSFLLACALLLKQLGSKKQVIGFDSFSGFPSFHENDALENFQQLHGSIFTTKQFNMHLDYLELKKNINNKRTFDPSNISSSHDFQDASYEVLQRKIELLELDNIRLIKGNFDQTVPVYFEQEDTKIFAANIDCDLYEGYKIILPFVWEYAVNGAYLHLDEYFSLKFPGAKIACDKFFAENHIVPRKHDTPDHEFERWYIKKEE